MKDFLESIKVQLHDRLSSPLIGTFLLSWIVWNHRLLTVLFSDLAVSERFTFIDSTLYASAWTVVWKGVLAPLGCALAYIFIYPYPSKHIHGFWLRRQKELKEQRDQIEKATLLTRDESEEIKNRAYQRVREAEDEVRKLREELDVTRKALQDKQDPAKRLMGSLATPDAPDGYEKFPELRDHLSQSWPLPKPRYAPSPGARKVIEELAKHGGRRLESQIFEAFDEPRLAVETYLDEVKRLSLANYVNETGSAAKLGLNEMGRAYAFVEKLVPTKAQST